MQAGGFGFGLIPSWGAQSMRFRPEVWLEQAVKRINLPQGVDSGEMAFSFNARSGAAPSVECPALSQAIVDFP